MYTSRGVYKGRGFAHARYPEARIPLCSLRRNEPERKNSESANLTKLFRGRIVKRDRKKRRNNKGDGRKEGRAFNHGHCIGIGRVRDGR